MRRKAKQSTTFILQTVRIPLLALQDAIRSKMATINGRDDIPHRIERVSFDETTGELTITMTAEVASN